MSRNKLSFDGNGVNDNDEYRSRIATFTNEDMAKKYGKIFEAAPELLEALEIIKLRTSGYRDDTMQRIFTTANEAINKLTNTKG